MDLDRETKIKKEETDRDTAAECQNEESTTNSVMKQENSDPSASVPSSSSSVRPKSEVEDEVAGGGGRAGVGGQASSPDGDVGDVSRSSSASEEILPERSRGRGSRALPLEKVDVGLLQAESESMAVPEPDPLELDEPAEPEPAVKERPARLRRTVTPRQPALGAVTLSEDSYDEYTSSEEEEMRKTIMIGSAYQAVVPEGFSRYGSEKPYKHNDKLLWEPKSSLDNNQIEAYLRSSYELAEGAAEGIDVLPMGAHTRDDEQALYLLMQCNYNVEEALRKRRTNPPPPPNPSTLWTDEECRNFENGILTYGKDFHTIQAQKLRTRSVSEIVQFYYLWKKTERHDVFANKLRPDKKKYMLHPGVTLVVYELLERENQKEAASKETVVA